MKLRIAHIISSLERGGAETILFQIVHGIQSEFDQLIIFIHDGPYRQEFEKLHIPCVQLHAFGTYLNPFLWRQLWLLIQKFNPDVIHSSLWAANVMSRVMGKLLKIPTITTLHAIREHEGTLRAHIDKIVHIKSTKTIAATATIARSMLNSGNYRPGELSIIANGVDTQALFATAQQANISLPKEAATFVIGAVGRFVPVKNFDFLITAFDEFRMIFPSARLVIIGSGPEESKLRRLIKSLELEHFVTLLTGQVATPYYQFFDCFVHTSSHEGLSLVLLEALTFRVPVIVSLPTIVAGVNDHEVIIHKHNGLVVPPHDQIALVNALVQMIKDKDLRLQLAHEGYKTVSQHYTLSRMLEQYRETFYQVAQTRRMPPTDRSHIS